MLAARKENNEEGDGRYDHDHFSAVLSLPSRHVSVLSFSLLDGSEALLLICTFTDRIANPLKK